MERPVESWALWTAAAVSAFGLLLETRGVFVREWRWLWASAAMAAPFVSAVRAKAIRPWAWAVCALELLAALLALRSWSGAVDLLPSALFCAAFALGTVCSVPEKGKRAALALAAGSLVLGLGLADYFQIAQPWRAKGDFQVAGLFGQRNTLMMFAAATIPVWAWIAAKTPSRFLRAWSGLLCAVAVLMPFAERSLTAWIAWGAGVATAVCCAVFHTKRIRPAAKLAAAGAVAVAIAVVAASDFAADFLRDKAVSFVSRTEIYEAAARAGAENLPWGTGLGGFARVSVDLMPSDTVSGLQRQSVASGAHNHWLQAWAERGLFGTLLVAFLSALVFLGVCSSLKRDPPLVSTLFAATGAMLAVHASFDLSTHAFPTTAALFALFCGAACSRLRPGLLDRADALLCSRVPADRWRAGVCAVLALLTLYGGFLAERRARSERAADEAERTMAVVPGRSLRGVADALEIDPGNPLPRWLLAGFLRTNGKLDDARAHLDYLESIAGDRFPVAEERARIAEATGDWETVLAESEKALRRSALWNNRMWLSRTLALARLGRCDGFAAAKSLALRWSWNPDRATTGTVLVPQPPSLRDREPLLRDLQSLEMVVCPAPRD